MNRAVAGLHSLLNNQLSVGCVIPVLNEAKGLHGLISRLVHLEADEIVLVDGGSIDGSREILQESGLEWIRSEPGRAIQMNAGSSRIKSDIVLFIHADTEITSSDIEVVRKVMRDSQYAAGRFDVRLSGGAVAFRLIESMINLRSRLTKISTGDQCIFVRRSVFDEMGGFPNQPLMEDIEISKRLKRLGGIACLHEKVITSSRRWQRFGIFRTVVLMWRLRLLYWLGGDVQALVQMYRQAR